MEGCEGSGYNISQHNNKAAMDDSDSDYEKENIRPRGLTGLQNLGNTCYLNSALQSLSNCPPLTQYFLDCESLIRPEKSPKLSQSYLKLISELWHKKRPSYVVPSGIVSGIKVVHPMFRGFTQQDAQEFLRCLMDQLHEELKCPVVLSDDSDDSDEEEDDDDGNDFCSVEARNNTNNAMQQEDSPVEVPRRPSFDSISSQSELDYETCDSGLSSERSSNAGRDVGSSNENVSDMAGEGSVKGQEIMRTRKMSAMSASSGGEEFYTPPMDMVANTKEMKETANLLEKVTEMRKGKASMEGGDSKDQGGPSVPASPIAPVVAMAFKDGEVQTSPAGTPIMPSVKPKVTPVKTSKKSKKPPNIRHDSIISQTFDGKILSSVRCLNCETVSTTKETFQDLSLPIPNKDHIHMLHSGYPSSSSGVSPPKGGACGEVNQGWLFSMFSWMKSWFIGPTVTLQDCLAAFFSADELKGDNMYSCGKCKKLRNGLKYSKVLDLPEILSVHLKRFRHEFYSSKISTYISFPLEGLDMGPYLDKDCSNETTTYDLVAIICHHGTAGGGHYTAYCLNHLNGQWYEFDDQFVTEVDVHQVQNCEAYVLFYRKNNKKIDRLRKSISKMISEERASILKFYISRQWLSRFHTFAEPGPITNADFLCKHGGVPPGKISLLDHLIEELSPDTWEVLYNRFGGDMVCNHLFVCKECEREQERLRQRQHHEKEMFIQLNEEFQDDEYTGPVYAISMAWFRKWECFVREKTDSPPDKIDNFPIMVTRNGQTTLRQNSDHSHLSKDMWLFLHRIYGGGPEVLFRQSTGALVKSSNIATASSPPHAQSHVQQSQGKPTLASIAAAAAAASTSTPASSSSSSSVYPQLTSSAPACSSQDQTSISTVSVSSSPSASPASIKDTTSSSAGSPCRQPATSSAESEHVQSNTDNIDSCSPPEIAADTMESTSKAAACHSSPQKENSAEENQVQQEPSADRKCNRMENCREESTQGAEPLDAESYGKTDTEAPMDSQSLSSLDGYNIDKNMRCVSLDSGISSETSPSSEDQSCVTVTDIIDTRPLSGDVICKNNETNCPDSKDDAGSVLSSEIKSNLAEANKSSVPIEKPTGKRGKNKKKKIKNMEVTQI